MTYSQHPKGWGILKKMAKKKQPMFKTEDLKLSREQELVMALTTEEIKTIIKALEWCVEGEYYYGKKNRLVDIGETTNKEICKVLTKLQEGGNSSQP
jgi:hypothetical protein